MLFSSLALDLFKIEIIKIASASLCCSLRLLHKEIHSPFLCHLPKSKIGLATCGEYWHFLQGFEKFYVVVSPYLWF